MASDRDTTKAIHDALVMFNRDKIWASELQFFGGKRRIDFWTLAPTASQKFRTVAYEIKVSRADFKRDDDVKQSGALRYSDRFWYVTPPDLLARDQIPSWAGLQEWDGNMFNVKKLAPKLEPKEQPDWQMVVSILRNSGDCRRDVDLLKQQLAWTTGRMERLEEAERQNSRRIFEKWMRRGGAPLNV